MHIVKFPLKKIKQKMFNCVAILSVSEIFLSENILRYKFCKINIVRGDKFWYTEKFIFAKSTTIITVYLPG